MTNRHNETSDRATGPYAHKDIKRYICVKCGLPWINVKRYDNHRLEDHP